MRILIAEDDFTSRSILVAVLKKAGHEVVETVNGDEAWAELQKPGAPKLIILDWIMPEMDGLEVLNRVRNLNNKPPAYIIMLTSKNEKADVIAGLNAGADDYLTKPFDFGELKARVEVGRRIVEMQEQLKESNDLQELLIDIITHDLKNPAGVIQSISMILREEIPGNEMIELVHSSGNRLMEVMENTTALAKTTSGERIEREIHSLSRIIKEVVNDFNSQLSTAGMALSINLDSELQVRVNPIISEVFVNYLSNIIKYASATNQIIIDAEENDNAITIRVKDEGETIPLKDRENIFRRSYQIAKKEKRGRGLGLAIVKRIAAAHDGEVWVEPNTPKGNSFCLRIPR